MNIFGIGPLEFVLIMLIALIILGPKDMGKAGMAVGKFLRKVITSEEWRILTRASREITSLPTRLMREAGLEEIQKELPTPEKLMQESGLADLQKDLKKEADQVQEEFSAWTTPIDLNPAPPPEEPKASEDQKEPGEPKADGGSMVSENTTIPTPSASENTTLPTPPASENNS